MTRSEDGSGNSDSGTGSDDAFLREVARIEDDSDVTPPERAMGSRLGRFVLRSELGRGGMGIVYDAHDPTLGRNVALKVLPSDRERDPQRRARFLREARSAASIVHPNVATIYEIGEAETSLFIAMELVPGESLRARFAAGRPLPVDDVVAIAKGIVRGLVAAHAEGIVHRDLKPENVMVGGKGLLKILDFGLAKLRDAREAPREVLEHQPTDAASTAEGQLLGTPAYMSPEQAAGKPLDARSDLFSLGVVLYEALTGGRPFSGETSFETLASVMRDTPAPLSTVNPEVPADLAALVMRCLAKAPAERPASANELLVALEALGRRPPLNTNALRLVAMAAAVALVAVVVAAFVTRATTPSAPHHDADTPGVRHAIMGTTDAPFSPTTSDRARDHFVEGVRLMWSGLPLARRSFDSALELDPNFASAHLERAILDQLYNVATADASWIAPSDDEARRDVTAALAAKATLPPRDADLLDAVAQMVHDPPDWAGAARRLEELSRRWPDDATVAFVAGLVEINQMHGDKALAFLERSADLDPNSVLGLAAAATVRSDVVGFVGIPDVFDLARARRGAEACRARTPTAVACRLPIMSTLTSEGRCDDLERLSRDLGTLDPDSPLGPFHRANAIAKTGSLPAISDLLTQSLARESPAGKTSNAKSYAFELATMAGDLRGGAGIARHNVETAATANELSTWQLPLLQMEIEIGELPVAARIATDALAIAAARPAPTSLVFDNTGVWLRVAYEGRLISRESFRERREAWFASWRARLDDHGWRYGGLTAWIWTYSPYYAIDLSRDEANEALEKLSSIDRMPLAHPPNDVGTTGALGAILVAAGRADEALPFLDVATRLCTLDRYLQARPWLDLGRARAQKSDRAGACSAYAEVLRLWGHAKPRSVTAEMARAEATKLGCARVP